ncbi:hypothetical protein CHOTACABRAS_14 [Bacillus phage Chotacabras]|nr:hypothetical protein CHOTACABRAS_14 [Bacillus phage Chotacabras]
MDELESLKDWHKFYRLFITSQLLTTEDDQFFLLDVADAFTKFVRDVEEGKIEVDADGYTLSGEIPKKIKWSKGMGVGKWVSVADEINRWRD